jgi:hypothetical protein
MGWMTKVVMVHMVAGSRDFSLLQSMQTSSGAHPASYSMGAGP